MHPSTRRALLSATLLSVVVGCSFDWNVDSAACPPDEPALGSACEGTPRCEYGTDARPGCRKVYTCQGSQGWTDANAALQCGKCLVTTGGKCPASRDDPAPTCAPDGPLLCTFPDDWQCGCTDGAWQCVAPPSDASCPASAPNFGAPCTQDNLACTYGSCGFGTRIMRTCIGGIWFDEKTDCPPGGECEG